MTLQPAVLVAGAGTSSELAGFVDGVYTEARFNSPAGMAMGADGYTAYICDYGNNAIRVLDTRTRAVTTLVAGAPLDKPIHLTVARSGNIYVSCASNGDRFSPVVKVTPGASMSIVGQAHQPRGIAVNDSETLLYLMETGHTFFGEIWHNANAEMSTGGALTDRSELGRFNSVEGACLAPDGYLYGVCCDTYFYSSGAGFKRFTPGGGALWHESGAPPEQGFSVFSSPSGGDYGTRRRGLVAVSGHDGRMWFYNTVNSNAVHLTKLNLGATGGIHSDEAIGSVGGAFGICLNSQDTVYVSASGLTENIGSAQGGSSVIFYYGAGTGLNSIYLIGCPPLETAVASDPQTRLVIDDGVQTVRGKLKGAPSQSITETRDRCGRPLTVEMSKPTTRLRARQP